MKKTLRTTLVGTALAGSLSFLNGCTTVPVNDADIASVVFGLSAIAPNGLTPSQRDAMGLLSNVSGEMGRRIHEEKIAEISKPEVHINNYITPQSTPSPEEKYCDELKRRFYEE